MRTEWIIIVVAAILAGCANPEPGGVHAIRGGMTVEDVGTLLGATGTMGRWSGQTGYFVYRLPSGEKVSVSCIQTGEETYCVHSNLTVCVQDEERGQKKWIKKSNITLHGTQ